MGIIDKYIPEKQLALDYNAAKIIASPYDYKLTERIFFLDTYDCTNHYNLYSKGYGTERYLCDALSLSEEPYLNVRKDIATVLSNDDCDNVSAAIMPVMKECGYVGTFIKYNNLIINDAPLLKDFQYAYAIENGGVCLSEKSIVEYINKNKYLKALEVLFTKGTLKESLIPNLMYLVTEYSDKSLNDIENITFAKEQMESGKSPLVKIIPYSDEIESYAANFSSWPEKAIAAAMVPIYSKTHIPADWSLMGDSLVFNSVTNLDIPLYNLGFCYGIIYGCELLYHFTNIVDDTIKDTLEKLLAIGYTKDSACTQYLYSVDDKGSIIIHPEVSACFTPDNETRFNYIREYFEKVLTDLHKGLAVSSNLEWFRYPTIFGRLVQSLHGYAFQVCRIKHATLLYNEAKNRGVIDKDFLNAAIEDDDDNDEAGLFGGSAALADSDIPNELLDLSTFESKGDKPLSDEDKVNKEKLVAKKDKEMGPMLNAADRLKKDLHDSKYDFDINYVKNGNSNKDAYNSISNSINMITHELTRQIKEIKTYNTGGKQGGLLVGKLDKKNLWKYKTDPHIFYNNNYKLKEMDLAFGCVLDESGSMHGEKIKNGRIVMIMLHEVLNSLGINHSIIGHTSHSMYQSVIYKYFQFKEEAHYSLDKPYGLVSADNRHGNCDSGALYYMQSVMKSVKNKDKIVIIFSDGQPTECTDLDLTEQVQNMEKEGIHVIGVGINFESIKNYYPDNANGKNLKEMVDIVVSILKRYVLDKKENNNE